MIKNYKWYDILQYAALLVMAAAMPIAWRFGLWVALALGGVTLVKIIAQRKVGNPMLDKHLCWTMCAPVIYWLVLAVSMLWTIDLTAGWNILALKAGLLIFPLCFLLSDTSYLTAIHLRGLGYALLLAVWGAFIYFAVKAGVSMAHGSSFSSVTGALFDSRHHAYVALYFVVAMVFVYHELASHWKSLKGWQRGGLIASVPMLVCYVVLVNSRAGILVMGLTGVACVSHLAISRRSWKLGAGIGILFVAAIVAATQLLPGYVDRFSSTLENVETDARTGINQENWKLYKAQPVLGYGVGDYRAAQLQMYSQDGHEGWGFNSHNQYMESLVSAGILGLLAFLYFMSIHLIVAVRNRSRFLFPLATATGVVALNLLFESMLERQMGLLFIGYLLSIMVLILSVEKNKFGQSVKS